MSCQFAMPFLTIRIQPRAWLKSGAPDSTSHPHTLSRGFVSSRGKTATAACRMTQAGYTRHRQWARWQELPQPDSRPSREQPNRRIASIRPTTIKRIGRFGRIDRRSMHWPNTINSVTDTRPGSKRSADPILRMKLHPSRNQRHVPAGACGADVALRELPPQKTTLWFERPARSLQRDRAGAAFPSSDGKPW